MRSIWTGSTSFGLINIPVKIFSAEQESSLDLLKREVFHVPDTVEPTW